MNYFSRSDRRAETEPAEERRAEVTVESVSFRGVDRCPWCNQSTQRHRPEALARCEAAFQAHMNRRLAGPMRVRDVSARGGAT